MFETATIGLNLQIRLYMFRKLVPHVVHVIAAHSQQNGFRYKLQLFGAQIANIGGS
jgi:hypothetical protein